MSTGSTLGDQTAPIDRSGVSALRISQTSHLLARREELRHDVAEVLARMASGLSSRADAAAGDISADRQVLIAFELGDFRYVLVRQQVVATAHLSPREQEIVRLVAEGLPNKTIGAILDISAWTVATHLRRIFAKLGVTSRSAMVARTVEQTGQLQPPAR